MTEIASVQGHEAIYCLQIKQVLWIGASGKAVDVVMSFWPFSSRPLRRTTPGQNRGHET